MAVEEEKNRIFLRIIVLDTYLWCELSREDKTIQYV